MGDCASCAGWNGGGSDALCSRCRIRLFDIKAMMIAAPTRVAVLILQCPEMRKPIATLKIQEGKVRPADAD